MEFALYSNLQYSIPDFLHCLKNNQNLRLKAETCHGWRRFNSICLVSRPDSVHIQNSMFIFYFFLTYTVCKQKRWHLLLPGSVFMSKFRLCLAQCMIHITVKCLSLYKLSLNVRRQSYFRKILLSPSSPAMNLSLFLVRGKKDSTPPPLHLGVSTIHQPTDLSVTWLIDCYLQVGVNDPTCSRTQMPSVFTGRRNYRYQNQFIIPCTHRAGGRLKILN